MLTTFGRFSIIKEYIPKFCASFSPQTTKQACDNRPEAVRTCESTALARFVSMSVYFRRLPKGCLDCCCKAELIPVVQYFTNSKSTSNNNNGNVSINMPGAAISPSPHFQPIQEQPGQEHASLWQKANFRPCYVVLRQPPLPGLI